MAVYMVNEFLGLWRDLIKKANGPALCLIIICLFLLTLTQILKSTDAQTNYYLFRFAALAALGALFFILYLGRKSKPKKKQTTRKQTKALLCPNCGNAVVPVKIGKMYRCPLCPHEFTSSEQQAKAFREWINVVKELQ
jgi:ribosomal protein L37AE/L43A